MSESSERILEIEIADLKRSIDTTVDFLTTVWLQPAISQESKERITDVSTKILNKAYHEMGRLAVYKDELVQRRLKSYLHIT